MRRGLEPRQVGRQEGHRRAAEIAGAGDPSELLEEKMARRGFRPVRADRGRRVDFVLGRCPFADVASQDPATVCQLHLGLAEGLTEGLGGLSVEKLVVENAHKGGCRLIVQQESEPTASS